MGGIFSGGGRHEAQQPQQQPSAPAPEPVVEKPSVAKTMSRFAGAAKKKELEAAAQAEIAKKKLLGE